MSPPTIAELLASLEAADLIADHRDGDVALASICPICWRPMIWHLDSPGFVCECGANGCEHRCTPSRIADEIHQRAQTRRGGYGREPGWIEGAANHVDRAENAQPPPEAPSGPKHPPSRARTHAEATTSVYFS